MFQNTIDGKQHITDQEGNEIVDLTTSIFKNSATGIDTYNTIRMIDYFQMRPDKVAINEYKSDEGTEFILKYSGISNPFSLKDDDILIIPNMEQATAQMTDYTEEQNTTKESQVKLYYKYTNTDFKSDSTSYDKLANKTIKSGVLDPTETGSFTVPYISDDGETAITIRNGRMYFGDYKAVNDTTVDTDSQSKLQTLLDSKCLTQGMSLTDFVKASTISSIENKVNNLSTSALTEDDINSAYSKADTTYQDILNTYLNNL